VRHAECIVPNAFLIPNIREGRDQRDPPAAVMDDLVANTLRTAAGLAKAATGQQQPDPPIAFRRLLVGPPPPAPIVLDGFELAVTRLFQERRELFWRQRFRAPPRVGGATPPCGYPILI
jgi:hypothetical protein